jgi:hypothetical protein
MKLFKGGAVYVIDKMKNQYILIIIRENLFICPKQLRWQTDVRSSMSNVRDSFLNSSY